jgi:hypothetical protein
MKQKKKTKLQIKNQMAKKLLNKKLPQKVYKEEILERTTSSSLTNGCLEINTHRNTEA